LQLQLITHTTTQETTRNKLLLGRFYLLVLN